MAKEEKKTSLKEDIFDWIESMAISIFVVVLIFTFVFRIVQVKGTSMLQTLQDSDRIITTNLFYEPKPGDIIVCNSVGLKETIVKRVIGVSGDTIDIDFEKGIVYRNGEVLEEEYINNPTTRNYDVNFPVTVPEDSVFVLGDNRKVSLDSRSSDVGFVEKEQITGKVIFRIFPFKSFGIIKSADLEG